MIMINNNGSYVFDLKKEGKPQSRTDGPGHIGTTGIEVYDTSPENGVLITPRGDVTRIYPGGLLVAI